MMRPFLLILLGTLLIVSSVWAKGRKPEYPRYEPPRFEDLPLSDSQAPAQATPEADAVSAVIVPEEPAPVEPTPEPPSAPEPAAPSVVEETPPPAPAPAPKMGAYKVWIWQETGDTLWRIAEKVYGDRSKWRLIYLANKDVIKDPNKIYPKQKLKIPPADWQPDGY
jgi:nucleoid-associated protein YgaU